MIYGKYLHTWYKKEKYNVCISFYSVQKKSLGNGSSVVENASIFDKTSIWFKKIHHNRLEAYFYRQFDSLRYTMGRK